MHMSFNTVHQNHVTQLEEKQEKQVVFNTTQELPWYVILQFV